MGVRCQVSGVRCQVSGVRCQVSGVRYEDKRNQESEQPGIRARVTLIPDFLIPNLLIPDLLIS